MIKQNNAFSRKCISILLALAAFCAIPAAAGAADPGEITPYASYYLSNYGGQITGQNRSTVSVDFDVVAYTYLDWLGAESIYIYESNGGGFKAIVKFVNSTTGGALLKANAKSHGAIVHYNKGIRGANYYGVINFYGEKDGGYDYRAYTTPNMLL